VTIIHDDIVCAECQYSLKGLDDRGVCPECGHAISRTTLSTRYERYLNKDNLEPNDELSAYMAQSREVERQQAISAGQLERWERIIERF
jgi:anaerobic ribonucleoside-triphosphate reductase